MLYLHYMIKHLKDNARDMNPVEVLEQKRMLERSASYGSIAAKLGSRLLGPVFAHIQENLMICEVCAWGSNPGAQHFPKCNTTLTTLQARAQDIVDNSANSLLEDAATAVLDSGDASDPNRHRDVGHQPVDMDGTFPQGCHPGHFGLEVLNVTYFAQCDVSGHTQARQCPPQNQKKNGC